MAIKLISSAFAEGEPIPKKYTGEGGDVSPPFSWSELPKRAKELALICDDPDALTKEPWVHWVIYKIPATVEGLREGIPRVRQLTNPYGALQGKNSWVGAGTIGYRGPLPPLGHGVHRYYFRLYALELQMAVESGWDKKALLNVIGEHILDEGVLMGTYQR